MARPEGTDAPQALVVGGSGMLRGACLSLADAGWDVGVVGRDRRRLDAMVQEAQGAAAAAGRILPIEADYENLPSYEAALGRHVAAVAPIRLVVSWVHGGAEAALEATLSAVETKEAPSRTLLEVRAHSVDGRERPPATRVHLGPAWTRREAVLGFRVDGEGHPRWLTDREIAEGLATALGDGAPHLTLGSTGQWAVKD